MFPLSQEELCFHQYNDDEGECHRQERIVQRLLSIVVDFAENILSGEFKFNWNNLEVDFDFGTMQYFASETKNKSLSHFSPISSIRHITALMATFEVIFQNVVSHQCIKKRQLYYLDPRLFKAQQYTDKLLKEISLTTHLQRNSLQIVASNKGLVAAGDNPQTVTPLNVLNMHFAELSFDKFHFILIVEKETVKKVFSQLLSTPNLFQKLGPALLLTAKGYPDLETEYFVTRIKKKYPELPMFFLGDCDPYGIDILCQYAFSNRDFVYEECGNPDIHWLGLFPEELLHPSSNLELNIYDERKIQELLSRPYFNSNFPLDLDEFCSEIQQRFEKIQLWREKIILMQKSKKKAEIEILYKDSSSNLINYISNKIKKNLFL